MRKSRYTEEQIVGILKESEAGLPTAELCRKHGISEQTFYRWKAKYGGLEVSEARRLRQLEEENRKLKQLVAEQALDIVGFKAALVAILFSFFVAWIAQKGVGASTAVNLAINIIQISALIVFSVLALGYRVNHPAGSTGFQYDSQTLATYTYQFATNPKDGSTLRDASGIPLPLLDAAGKPIPFQVAYPRADSSGNFLTHPSAASVIVPHNFNWIFIQATVAILILVGFESVTTMGGEAKNPSRHIPIAVIASLLIQGLVCYLIEYFAANYFLNSGYTMQSATASAAP